MIDIYDCEALVKVYHTLEKKCNVIDKFIHNHAYYCGPYTDEYSAVDVYNDILDLMERKNQLINIKVIIDDAIEKMSVVDKQVLLIKLKYSISMNEFCGVLNMKQRTAFRRIERAFENLAEVLNNSKYASKLVQTIRKEDWINAVKQDVKERRMNFKGQAGEFAEVSSL